MKHTDVSKREAFLLALTVMRLGLGAGLCFALWQHASPYISVIWLTAVVVADIADGIIARWLGVDTNRRRILDAVIDRLTIHTTTLVMCLMPETILLLLPVIIRDIVLIIRNWWLLVNKRVIIGPGNIHRAGTFLYAVLYATTLFTTGKVAFWVSIVISVTVWFLLLDYLRAGALVPAHPRNGAFGRYKACGLRALFWGRAPTLQNEVGT